MIQKIIDTIKRLDDYYSTREGPYGVYNYNKISVRDFADVRIEDYGRVIAEFDTREEAYAFAEQMRLRLYAVEILKAMREPTDAMLNAVYASPVCCLSEAWPMMIDEAMK